MKRRKMVWLLVLAAMGATMLLPSASQGAVGPLIADPQNDTIDIIRHPQNSFRPNSPCVAGAFPYCAYQYSVDTPSIMDITSVQAFTATPVIDRMRLVMKLKSPAPVNGAPLTALPRPFSEIVYSFYFQTTGQDAAGSIGTECFPKYSNDLGPSAQNRIYIFETTRTSTCPAAATPAAENTQTASGTAPATSQPIPIEPHPRSDGWWGAVSLSLGQEVNTGVAGYCKNIGDAFCLRYNLQVGQYEGYSGFSELFQENQLTSATQTAMNWTVVGNTITVEIPYESKFLSVDDDLLVDDQLTWPWKFNQGATPKLTALVGQINGVYEIQAPTRTCPFGPKFFPDAGAPLNGPGQPNPLPGGLGNPLYDQSAAACVTGIFGLLTVRDWAPNAGFELRAFPRSPAYTADDSSVKCRYPVGHFPAPPVPISVGPFPTGIDATTSPFDKPWKVGVWTHNPPAPITPVVPGQSGVVLPPGSVIGWPGGALGQNTACGYNYVPYGLHYFDAVTDVAM